MRIPKVHSESSINFTKSATFWCVMINYYKKIYPTHSFKEIAKHFGLSQTNARRYYYGIHHFNPGCHRGSCFTQMREGACVPI